MKIGNLMRPYMRELRELNAGDTFIYDNDLWMKLDPGNTSVNLSRYENEGADPVLCVQVNTGVITIFDQNLYTDQDPTPEGFKVETFDARVISERALREAVASMEVYEQLTGEWVPW